jgi:hypothetical protein
MIAAKMAEPKPEVVDPLQQELAREQEKLKRKMALLKAEVEVGSRYICSQINYSLLIIYTITQALRRLTMPHGQAPVKEEEEGEKVKAEDI